MAGCITMPSGISCLSYLCTFTRISKVVGTWNDPNTLRTVLTLAASQISLMGG